MKKSSNQESPTQEEIQVAAQLLSKLEPGFLPFSIFHQIARLTATPIVEIVPLRQYNGSFQILLQKRDSSDPVWPNKLHTPGTAVRATDSLQDCFDRLLKQELVGVIASDPRFVASVIHDSGRGNEAALVYWVEVFDNKSNGQFYDVAKLPQELVKSQLDFIPQVINAYKSRQ
jgi:ADP-ribose pyrophosphatase YjhB (NUDIX family)